MKGLGNGAIIAIVLVMLILGFVSIAFVAPLISESPVAVLTVDQGMVEVANSPFQQVTGEKQISEGTAIRTGPGSKASIIFFGSSVVRLGENTTINITDISTGKEDRKVTIKQDSGRIWNKVLKLSGFNNYEVETPNSVASIRGTAFENWIRGDLTATSVVEGTVNVLSKGTGNDADVPEEQAADVSEGNPALRPLEANDFITENKELDRQFLAKLRERLKTKYWMYIYIAKTQYGLTDEQIDQYIDDALSDKYSSEQIDNTLAQFGLELKP